MYESADYGSGKITHDDLPDELMLYYGGIEFLMPKVTPEFDEYTSLEPNYALYGILNPFDTPNETIRVVIGYEGGLSSDWLVYLETGGDDFANFECFGSKDIHPIGLGYFSITAIYDNFPSSFSVNGPKKGIVTRPIKWTKTEAQYLQELQEYDGTGPRPKNARTICKWLGDSISLRWNPRTAKWQVNGFNKLGFQNTPVGQYEGGYSVS